MQPAEHDRIPEIALDWHRAGKGAALATVTGTWGSAPRPVGAQLVVARSGEMMGSVSGGCVEGAVVEEARAALADGRARALSYGVSDDEAFAVSLACGGTITILVEPVGSVLPEALLADLVAARAARCAVAHVRAAKGGGGWLIARDRSAGTGLDAAALDAAALEERFRADRSGLEGDRFIAIHNPPLRLIVVGAVHIAQPLVTMARACGYDLWLIDPREAFGSAARFPGEDVCHDWPDAAMAAIGLDARTAVVTLTHDPKLDDPAISAALGAPVFYLGCLGSTRTHARRLDRLTAAGFSPADLGRIHAPVGLDIGARSPAEIAVSVIAEITRTLRRG